MQLKSDDTSWYYVHSLVEHFHVSWNTDHNQDLKTKFDQALRSEISQRWWKHENYRPKEIMMKLIEADAELAAIAFKDLSNDTATLDGRLSRFIFYAEELLQMHRQKNKRDIENHHHQDAAMLSLYLAGMFPDKYTLYPGLDTFKSFCKNIGSPDIPVVDDLVRYSKVTAIVYKFFQKNILSEKLIEQRTSTMHKTKFIPFQVTYEFICFGGDRNSSQS